MFRLLKKLLSLFRRKRAVDFSISAARLEAITKLAMSDLEWLDYKYQHIAIKDKRFFNAAESDNKCKIDVLAYLKADAAYHKDYPGAYEKWAQENPEKIKKWREDMRCVQDEKPNG